MQKITAEEFDRKFDDGEDISEYLDWSKASRPNLEPAEMTVTIKRGILLQLEQRADQLGVTRDALLETWLREKLEERRSSAAE